MRGVSTCPRGAVTGMALLAIMGVLWVAPSPSRADEDEGQAIAPAPLPAPPATRPDAYPVSTTQPATTMPTAADGSTPADALNQFQSLLRENGLAEARGLLLAPKQEAVAGETDFRLQAMAAPIAAGQSRYEPVEQRTEHGLTLLLAQNVKTGAFLHDYSRVYMVQRDGAWRILLAPPERYALTDEERAGVAPLAEWSTARIRELQLADLERLGIK